MRERFRGSGTLVAGVVIGLLLAPIGAYAAGQLVEISSPSGRKAQVSRAQQLYAAETSPEQYRRGYAVVRDPTWICLPVLTAASGKALVVKSVIIETDATPSPSSGDWIALWADPSCSDLVAHSTPTEIGPEQLTFEPGLRIPAGSGLYADGNGEVRAYVYAFGYDVPASAVPAASAGEARPAPPQGDGP